MRPLCPLENAKGGSAPGAGDSERVQHPGQRRGRWPVRRRLRSTRSGAARLRSSAERRLGRCLRRSACRSGPAAASGSLGLCGRTRSTAALSPACARRPWPAGDLASCWSQGPGRGAVGGAAGSGIGFVAAVQRAGAARGLQSQAARAPQACSWGTCPWTTCCCGPGLAFDAAPHAAGGRGRGLVRTRRSAPWTLSWSPTRC